MTEWTEDGDGTSLVVVFDGLDAEKREQREIQTFRRGVAARELEIWRVLRASLATGFFVGLGLLRAAIAVGGLKGAALTLIFALGLVAPTALVGVWYAVRRSRAEDPLAPFRARFTITLDRSGLSVTSPQTRSTPVRLGDIAQLEGAQRLVIVQMDGTRHALPCVLHGAGDNARLAARLNEGLAMARAAAGGYRGQGDPGSVSHEPPIKLRGPAA